MALSEATKRSRDLTCFYKEPEGRWLILELHDDIDIGGLYHEIENDIISTFGPDIDYFIPVYSEKVKDKRACVELFDGYIFVQEKPTTEECLGKMKSEYIKGPLMSSIGYDHASNTDINNFKKKLERKIRGMVPEKGQKVIPRVGTFRNMEGRVISVNRTTLVARVLFEKTSRVVEAPINVINLDAA
jgi:transcription antitermination factor NusG